MVLVMQTTLFYVDDDEDDLEFFKAATDAIGKSVTLFSLPEHLLEAINNPPPHPSIIFLDLNMPGKSGFDVLAEIKAMDVFENVPVIILSTANNITAIEKSWVLGASMYITKAQKAQHLQKSIEFVVNIDWENFTRNRATFVYKG